MEKVKIFKSGNSRAVRLSKKFDIEGDEAYIVRYGDGLILFPEKDNWKSLLASLDKFSDDFMQKREQPKLQDRGEIF